jgi:hypothetical protein
MADPVAIASIISTASVAIAVPFVGAQLERRRLLSQAQGERLSELRTLLDDAAVHLTQALWDLHDLEQDFKPKQRSAATAKVLDSADAVFRDNVRLSLRLGREHPLFLGHDKARRTLQGTEAQSRREQRPVTQAETGRLIHDINEWVDSVRTVMGIDPNQSRSALG